MEVLPGIASYLSNKSSLYPLQYLIIYGDWQLKLRHGSEVFACLNYKSSDCYHGHESLNSIQTRSEWYSRVGNIQPKVC